ncbi:DUF1338 domain-containing protein [Lyngbya confervoides]|uniref:2-oxoadipate dioxygenase/decarboxylase n=1 Tax=Lyngbya confervoides BDU141951 TaxID=1574623 RepID=A0ABD4SZM8_9CYAN|nr:DUF1338 domain-containing protein [Lyngbya confervoides]MCM1981828.1 DUF1338 domain-containing protein [Lyngbya confervoides BDU141951]
MNDPAPPPHLALALWQTLWEEYRQRVIYARQYQAMIEADGGILANDHLAFRALNLWISLPTGRINLGLAYLEPFLEFLGYQAAGDYAFPDQYLRAKHYRHPQQAAYNLPKIFMSELMVQDLPEAIATIIAENVQPFALTPFDHLGQQPLEKQIQTLKQLLSRPWPPPKQSAVESVNRVSQYGAWVLLHGYAVNHFTGYINQQRSPSYPTLERTVSGLKQRGIPMKAHIEGSVQTGLCQTATQAVQISVPVRTDQNQPVQILWPYAYYELAQRFPVPGSDDLFEGFLTHQAQELFKMTQPDP